jgi:hypothetical protein
LTIPLPAWYYSTWRVNMPNDWYGESRAVIQAVYGDDWAIMCALLAATSAHASLKANTTLARRAFQEIHDTGNVNHEHFQRVHYNAIQDVLRDAMPSTVKCRAFYHALVGVQTSIVVDIWMMRWAGYRQTVPTNRQRKLIIRRVQYRARKWHVPACQAQAIIWGKIRGSHQSYADLLRQLYLI